MIVQQDQRTSYWRIEYTTTSLNNTIEQLTKKMEKISKIYESLSELLDEIESAVLEAEELQDDITDKIARA